MVPKSTESNCQIRRTIDERHAALIALLPIDRCTCPHYHCSRTAQSSPLILTPTVLYVPNGVEWSQFQQNPTVRFGETAMSGMLQSQYVRRSIALPAFSPIAPERHSRLQSFFLPSSSTSQYESNGPKISRIQPSTSENVSWSNRHRCIAAPLPPPFTAIVP